jgi:hypothetical protein
MTFEASSSITTRKLQVSQMLDYNAKTASFLITITTHISIQSHTWREEKCRTRYSDKPLQPSKPLPRGDLLIRSHRKRHNLNFSRTLLYGTVPNAST